MVGLPTQLHRPPPTAPKSDPACRCRSGRSEGGSTLFIRVESGDLNVLGSHWPSALLVAAGREPFALVEHAVAAAAKLSGGAKARTDKLVPASLDSFGWCTWDAFYSRVSARGEARP